MLISIKSSEQIGDGPVGGHNPPDIIHNLSGENGFSE